MKIILLLILAILVPKAYAANCAFKGSTLTYTDGTSKDFIELSKALAAASKGSKILVGEILPEPEILIQGKSEIEITSDCDAKIGRLVFEKNSGLLIDGLEISAVGGSGLDIRGGDLANKGMVFKNLKITGELMSRSGIFVGQANKGIVIESVSISEVLDDGIIISAASEVTVHKSEVLNSSGNGIVVNQSASAIIKDNLISGNGKSAFGKARTSFGLHIQANPVVERNTVVLTNNRIIFNLGSLDTQLASDILGADLATSVSNLTTWGVEGTGYSKFDIAHIAARNEKTTKFLSTQNGPARVFLEKYGDVIALSLHGSSFAAGNYAFVTENYMDQCFAILGDSYKTLIIDLIHSVVGN